MIFKLKIFEITNSQYGQIAWVAGYGLMHALSIFNRATDSVYDWDEGDEIVELPEDKWDSYTVTEDEEPTITFTEWIEINKDPDMIAYAY